MEQIKCFTRGSAPDDSRSHVVQSRDKGGTRWITAIVFGDAPSRWLAAAVSARGYRAGIFVATALYRRTQGCCSDGAVSPCSQ